MAFNAKRVPTQYPSDWEIITFADITKDTQLGTTSRGESEDDKSIPLLKMGNITWGGLNIQEYELLSKSSIEDRLYLEEGDFLFNTRNTPELVGKSAVWHGELEKAVCDNNINRIKFKKKANPDFICSQLTFGPGKGRIRSLSAGSTSVAAIYWKDLAKLKVALPPLPEQKKIARILSTWDKAIETVDKLIENSKQQKKALMQQLLTGKKRLPGHITSKKYIKTKYGQIPQDWEFVPINKIAIQAGLRNGHEEGIPVLSCSKYDGFVDSLKYFKKKIYSDDLSNYKVILRGELGFPSNHIEEGSIGLQNKYDKGLVSPIYTVFKPKNNINCNYLYQLLKTDHYKQIFSAQTNASVDRRGSLRWKEFGLIKVPLPSLGEQSAIVNVVLKAEEVTHALILQAENLREQKQALMQQLLTGKRRVKIDDDRSLAQAG